MGFELVQLSRPLAEPRVGRPFADAGQDPADGFCPGGRAASGDQRVQHLQVRGAEPDVSRGEILLAPGWIVWRGTEPVPDLALAAVLAEPELQVAGAGKSLCELALKFADHRLVVPVPGRQVRVFPGLF